ncbi:MAG: biopolymer transporter ExbD [Deltaproteobacteria bacterium]|nr:biopolymer transporter ExbD [Deltaproteobacteria bacterium]
MRCLKKRDNSAALDISPLIDMVFILLIFFMVSTTFVKDMKIDIERPGAASATSASTKSIRIQLDRQGNIYIEGQPVKPWMLQSRVRDLMKSGASGQILVITDRLVPAEKLVEAVDQCRLAGATDIGVATEKEAG